MTYYPERRESNHQTKSSRHDYDSNRRSSNRNYECEQENRQQQRGDYKSNRGSSYSPLSRRPRSRSRSPSYSPQNRPSRRDRSRSQTAMNHSEKHYQHEYYDDYRRSPVSRRDYSPLQRREHGLRHRREYSPVQRREYSPYQRREYSPHQRRDFCSSQGREYNPVPEKRYRSRSPISRNSITPSPTILLRYITMHTKEKDIVEVLSQYNIVAKDIRLIKRPVDDGSVKCICFIEFSNTAIAELWMNATKGIVNVNNQAVSLVYCSQSIEEHSIEISSTDASKDSDQNDWSCIKCGLLNYKWRKECFKCATLRNDSSQSICGGEFYKGSIPSNTLLILGLNPTTTEQILLKSFKSISSINPKAIYVHRDDLTKKSCQFAFIEFNSVIEAHTALTHINQQKFECDDCSLQCHFGNNNFSNLILKISSSNISKTNAVDIIQKSRSIAMGAAMAEAASKNHNSSQHDSAPTSKQSPPTTYKYPEPDYNDSSYDPKTGYYFHRKTGLYYEPKSKYFYNPATQQFMTYDKNRQTYLVSNIAVTKTQQSQQNSASPANQSLNNSISSEKPSNSKSASEIAKDMARWAKRQNAKVTIPQNNSSKNVTHNTSQNTTQSSFVFQNDLSINNEIDIYDQSYTVSQMDCSSFNNGRFSPVIDHDDINSPEEEDKQHVKNYVDLVNLNCTLCNRHFNTPEILMKHVEKSKLHLDNLKKVK